MSDKVVLIDVMPFVGFMKFTISLIALSCLLFLAGCDQDPFGANNKKLAGEFYLNKSEGGIYYVFGTEKDGGGGVLDGTVQEIGWNDQIILAKRKAIFGGDPSGWMIIDVAAKSVTGPISEQEKLGNPKYSKILTEPPAVAWKR